MSRVSPSWFWKNALASPTLRKKIGFQLKEYYPDELDARIPISSTLSSPFFDLELGSSFSEIFLQGEYDGILKELSLPSKCIDIGCYAGFFSLWLTWKRELAGMERPQILMLDANTQLQDWVARMIRINGLNSCWNYQCAAIASEGEFCEFVERSYMGSSQLSVDDAPGERVQVPVMSPSRIQQLLPPPYDLIKVDIEGGEFDFVRSYQDVIRHTRHLCLEWHSWHPGGGGVEQIKQMLSELEFDNISEIQPPRKLPSEAETGVLLFRNSVLKD